ncbi:MAG: S8 family serine peptidase [Anaerolineae bacterium]|nr:S8 family serine peptidase [Anaerolineae bacterium]
MSRQPPRPRSPLRLLAALGAGLALAVALAGRGRAEGPPGVPILQAGPMAVRFSSGPGDGPLRLVDLPTDSESLSHATVLVARDAEGPVAWVEAEGDAPVSCIVQFPGQPLFAPGAAEERAAREAQHRSFLQALEGRGVPFRVRREYLRLFHGLALEMPARDAAWMRHHAADLGLRAVYPDRTVRATLAQSVPLIGAPEVWVMTDDQGRPVTGTGVRVAVIDSGVDYTHPDLGSGLGPGHKVITGYNFLNDSYDPMDDHGHGTHVAGIIAAQGSVVGVAPGASLLAYKVLNASGVGDESDVIAALERALDPDGDPATADGAHVINLSLGSTGGSPDDPMCQAVDAAVEAGAVVVAAAGNTGRFLDVHSPALARRAVAVGASTKADQLAPFSSRGPVPGSWAIKPDLLAPGAGIVSTWVGGQRATLGGTSMAAPHVAGAAALLRQRYPDEPPATLRGRLLNLAHSLGLSPFVEGAGRVQVDAAARAPGQWTPATLSLGMDDLSLPVWSTAQVLTLENWASRPLTWTLRVEEGGGGLPAGVGVMLYPEQLALGPGESGEALLAVSVDNTRVPDVPDPPHGYGGAVVAASEEGVLRVPFAFLKSPLLRLHFDEVPTLVLVHDRAGTVHQARPASTTEHLFLPAGTYDVAARFGGEGEPRYVVREGIALATQADVHISAAEARHRVRLDLRDEHGWPVPCNIFLMGLSHAGSGWLFFSSEVALASEDEALPLEVRFSDLSDAYRVDLVAARVVMNRFVPVYQFAVAREGLEGDWTFANRPEDLLSLRQSLQGPNGPLMLWEEVSLDAALSGISVEVTAPWRAPGERRTWHLAPVVQGARPQRLRRLLATLAASPPGVRLLYMSPGLAPADGETWRLYTPGVEAAPVEEVAASSMALGLWPVHAPIRLTSWLGGLALYPWQGGALWPFAGPWHDARPGGGVPFTLSGEGGVVRAGTLPADGWRSPDSPPPWTYLASSLPAGVYTATLTYTSTLYAREPLTATAEWVGRVDTASADAAAPAFTALQVLEGGRVTDRVGGAATVRFRVEDDTAVATVRVWIEVGEGWEQVSPYPEPGGRFWFTLPRQPEGTQVGLRLHARDLVGNEVWLTLRPAYVAERHRLWLPMASAARAAD